VTLSPYAPQPLVELVDTSLLPLVEPVETSPPELVSTSSTSEHTRKATTR
jgi:hypothetical protein